MFFLLSWHDALQAEGQEVASVVSAQEIRVVAELLQISPEGLQKAITYKVTVRTNCWYCNTNDDNDDETVFACYHEYIY